VAVNSARVWRREGLTSRPVDDVRQHAHELYQDRYNTARAEIRALRKALVRRTRSDGCGVLCWT
jgi:hypothetical protein